MLSLYNDLVKMNQENYENLALPEYCSLHLDEAYCLRREVDLLLAIMHWELTSWDILRELH